MHNLRDTFSITKGVAKKDKRYSDILCWLAACLTLGLSHLLTNRAISFEKDLEQRLLAFLTLYCSSSSCGDPNPKIILVATL